MRTHYRNTLWVIIFFGIIALCICFTSCKKNEAPAKIQTVSGFYDQPVINALAEIQKAVTDPNIDGYQFQCKVDSLEEYIETNHDLISSDIQRLEQSTLCGIELQYNFIIDHYEGIIN